MFHMKKFTIVLLGAILTALITCSIQSASADHLETGKGIFKDVKDVNLRGTQAVAGVLGDPPDFYYEPSGGLNNISNYQAYLQTTLRNGDGHLISIIESTVTAAYIPHKITDYVFDTLMGKKEIITIDNIKYEKVQYTFAPTLEQRWVGMYPIFEEIPIKYNLKEDTRTKMNEEKKDRSNWKIHYCATFEGHGYQCIPIIQVIIPTMVMEPDDVAINQWTILRELK